MASRKSLVKLAMATLAALSLATGCGVTTGFGLGAAGSDQLSAAGKSGNHKAGDLSLLVMPDAGPQPLLQAINSAQKSIYLEMYILTYSGITQQITDAMVARAKAGVDVRVILETQPYIPVAPGQQPININQAAIKALEAGGVRVQHSSPQFAYTHEKAMVIDGRTAWIMTMNFSNAALTQNREYLVIDQAASDVAEVSKIFQDDWNETPVTPKDPDLVVSPTNSRQKLLSLIDSATKTLVLQCEYMTDPEIIQHMADAQNNRHVQLSLMLSYQPKDPTTGDDSNGQEQQLLAQKGITSVHFVQSLDLHAKTIIVDGAKAYVGSENMTANSLDNNREMGILITDPTILATLVQTTAKDWQAK